MSDQHAVAVQQLHETAAEVPRLLDEAVQGVSTYAAAVAELVQNLDMRRSDLNQQARTLGLAPIPDALDTHVPPWDTDRVRLLTAARRGPGELAVELGKVSRDPAAEPGAATPFEAETMGDAARAAAALLTWTHHAVEGVAPGDLLADADPVKAAQLLAVLAVDLAKKAMPGRDVAEWIADLGAAWALDGD